MSIDIPAPTKPDSLPKSTTRKHRWGAVCIESKGSHARTYRGGRTKSRIVGWFNPAVFRTGREWGDSFWSTSRQLTLPHRSVAGLARRAFLSHLALFCGPLPGPVLHFPGFSTSTSAFLRGPHEL